jgi:hypothetical protein
MKWIHREISERLRSLLNSFPAVLVSGPRQCGKSSLLKRQFPDFTYVTFDDPFQVLKAEGSPRQFLAELGTPVILDEIQYVPELFRFIKIAIDSNRRNSQYLLTGSQNFHLGNMGCESLAGRMAILELTTLSGSEIRMAFPDTQLEDMVYIGGYPELWSASGNCSEWYSAYISTYLQRDIRSLSQVADLGAFSRFLRAVALRTGSLLNYADLARDIGVSPNTAKNWLSLLATSSVLSLIEGWYTNESSRLVKSPKAYFNDSGLLCSLLGIRSKEAMIDSPFFGAIWETWCFTQLRAWFLNRGRGTEHLYYWRTKEGKEVDFIMKGDSLFYAFECKTRELPTEQDARNLNLFAQSQGNTMVRKTILCRTPGFIERINALDVSIDNGCNLSRIFSPAD